MTKSIQVTPKIADLIRKSTGDDNIQFDQMSVFEATFVTTLPLKKGGFMQGAVIDNSALEQMVGIINAEGGSVPMHTNHFQGYEMPFGRAFFAEVMDRADGNKELRGMFYITHSSDDHKRLIKDIETSAIDEVSISVLFGAAKCSKCGFDYLAEETSHEHLWDMTCDKEHVIGKDGTHLKLSEVESWMELSLVSRGASQHAKILPRAKQRIGQDSMQRLAASQKPLEARVLCTSYKMSETRPSIKENKMDEKLILNLTEQVSNLKVDLAKTSTEREGLNKELDGLKAKLSTMTTELESLKKASDDGVTKMKAELDAEKASVKASEELLAPHVTAAAVASGVKEEDAPKTLEAMVKFINEKALKLHQVIGADGKAQGSKEDMKVDADDTGRKNAFKTTI